MTLYILKFNTDLKKIQTKNYSLKYNLFHFLTYKSLFFKFLIKMSIDNLAILCTLGQFISQA
jgi:hypothetical protein